jgi:hypothetical protein
MPTVSIDRRSFLAALGAALATPTRAATDEPIYLSACGDGEGAAAVAAFGEDGRLLYATRLPARGHDATARPASDDVVVFARRPGNWAAVVDRRNGAVRQVILSPADRHFFGHGVFSPDGRLLYATENVVESGDGVLGVYDAAGGYRRVGEMPTCGPGPHDLALVPGAAAPAILIANGGTRTRPESGREILNPDEMEPSLAIIDPRTGACLVKAELGAALRGLSIRHLAVAPDGTAVFGCQCEMEDGAEPPLLVGVLDRNGRAELIGMPDDDLAALDNYVGSVALDASGRLVAATSPRGSTIAFFDLAERRYVGRRRLSDVCGVAAAGPPDLFVVTSGNAGVRWAGTARGDLATFGGAALQRRMWDNHLLRIEQGG